MNKIKDALKNKKVVATIVAVALVVCGIGGYLFYDNNKKQETINKMSITFTDVKEVEYGTKEFDIQKELVKSVDNAEIKTLPTLDTNKVGDVTLTFVLEKSKLTKEITRKIKVVDTKAPDITLEAESKELTVGDEYDFMTNITSVKDVIDGDIALNKDASETNKKATEEYNKLSKEDIKEDTKVAEKSLNEFLVETVKGEDDKETSTLYFKNCYYVDGSVDIATASEYPISIIAVDKNGMKSTKEFKVTVKEKEKEVEQPVASNNGGSNSGRASSGGSSSTGGGNGGYTPAPTRGSKQDIVNTALAQVGKPYVRGASGPDAFDCSGLIYYAYNQNGWSISRSITYGGTRLSSSSELQPGDIIYMPNQNHVAMCIGGGQMVQAKNPGAGILVSEMNAVTVSDPDVQFIRY